MKALHAGFIVVRKTAWLLANRREWSGTLRKHPPEYRGVDREPLRARELEDVAREVRFAKHGALPESAAILAMSLQKRDSFGPALYVRLDDVHDIYTLLSNPDDWEVLYVAEGPGDWTPILPQTELLGYDVTNYPWFYESFLANDTRRNACGLLTSKEEADALCAKRNEQMISAVAVHGFSDVFYDHLLSPPRYEIGNIQSRAAGTNWLPGYTHEVQLLGFALKQSMLAAIATLRHYTGMTLEEARETIAGVPKVLRFTHIGSPLAFERRLIDVGFEIRSWTIGDVVSPERWRTT